MVYVIYSESFGKYAFGIFFHVFLKYFIASYEAKRYTLMSSDPKEKKAMSPKTLNYSKLAIQSERISSDL